ncbi:site-specific tyrosine recombinase XerC [Marinibactrum halimedae]|uniref:Tyrosine recombinase XerD n=1 Tax=Marinibactrum halimedae TaxID=1444977 RepID=A0AA37TE17_9GAMM|nr:site-specific tyrosine recombinase XerC [Marinibactrum halimedae]MCD9461238.1 site-specific tyrosine recombinase XerC [Marinibactrum halimedae]GLS28285.1 tyrosine recombinase XerD [Marinibactrum halimedae]
MLRKKRHNARFDRKREVAPNGLYPYMVHYLEWAKTVNQCSPDTLRRRDGSLRRFIAWCDERGLHHPGDITLPILERYQRYLFYYRKDNGEPLSLSSQNVMLSPLKSFFKWLTRERHIPSNPASEMQLPKRPRQLPKIVLHRDEIEQVLRQPDIKTPDGLRDRAILEVLYATGMRRMEVCNLQRHHVDKHRNAVLIQQGKGRKDRFVPMGERAMGWVKRYLEEAHPRLVGYDYEALFINDYGEQFTRCGMSKMVKKRFREAGVTQVGCCHLLRHACATHMLENGADIRVIQALLGHTDLNTTQIYTHVNIDHLSKIHSATHPALIESFGD